MVLTVLLIVCSLEGFTISAYALAPGDIYTVAGNGTPTYAGDLGPATQASLNFPFGTAVDSVGNLYIVDTFNCRIRKVDAATGIITTVVGNGPPGFGGDGGPAYDASLSNPYGVAVDNSGNLFIADYYNNRVRKVDAVSKIITTLVGNGPPGFGGDGGPAVDASLSTPTAVAVDSAGNVYIADYSNGSIRKVDAVSKIITTVAGNGVFGYGGPDGVPATSVSLGYLTGVAVDTTGTIYISDRVNHAIWKVDAISGAITKVISISYPTGVSVDSSGTFLYVPTGPWIQQVNIASGTISKTFGNGTISFSGDYGPATLAGLGVPNSSTVDTAGNIYIADTYNNRVRKIIKPDATSAAVTYSPPGPYKVGDTVTITATFNDQVQDPPVPQIALSGVNSVPATDMSKVDSTHYTYTHTVTGTAGTVFVSIPTGTDINGVALASIPNSGAVFTIVVPPLATTGTATAITASSATLNGTVNDYGANSTVTFDYGLSGTYGNSIAAGTVPAGSGSVPVNAVISGLACNTTYHYRVNAANLAGTTSGVDATFLTSACPAAPPTATTDPATAVTAIGATLNGTLSSNGADTTVTFDYGLTTGYGNSATAAQSPQAANASSAAVSAAISGLTCGTTYHYRVNGQNSAGTTSGLDATFLTGACAASSPTVTTDTATAMSFNSATLNGTASSNGTATTVTFEYGLTSGYGNTANATQGLLSANATGTAVSAAINGLTCGTTYHYRANGQNSSGTTNGLDVTFATSACPAPGSSIITTVAGNGTAAFFGDGGIGTSASLNAPYGLNLDSSGNIYIADFSNNLIRKVDAVTGIISTVAGNGTAGYGGDGAAATAAMLNNPIGLTVDSAGNIYIAEYSNHRVRKVIVATGIITTVAGNGSPGFSGDGGPATAASLISPSDVSLDSSGNIYIADTGNNRIRMVHATTGIITTVAGDGTPGFSGDNGPATGASLFDPSGITVDSGGNIYIAALENNRIRMVNAATGIITTVAGNGIYGGISGDGGLATSASLTWPYGLSMDSVANIYIAEARMSRIRKVNASTGIITTVAGTAAAGFSGDGGPVAAANINTPTRVSVDSAGNLYIADLANNRIRKVFTAGSTSSAISYSPAGPYKAGDQITISATFNDLVVDAPVPQIALSGANTLAAANMTKVDNRNYTFTHTVTAGSGTVTVSIPTGTDINGIPVSATPFSGGTFAIAIPPTATTDPASAGTTTATLNGTVNDNGAATTVIFDYGLTAGYGSSAPGGTVSAGSGAIPVSASISGLACSSTYHFRVLAGNIAGTVNGSDATFSTTACPASTPTITSGAASSVTLNGALLDGTASSNGAATTVTFNYGLTSGYGNSVTAAQSPLAAIATGTAVSATLTGLTCGSTYHYRASGLNSAGTTNGLDATFTTVACPAPGSSIITTIAGNGTASYAGDGGMATSASIRDPYGVSLDSSGNIYIADMSNNRIRKVDATTGKITTVAGSGTRGFSGDGGMATAARLNTPSGVSVDSSGNIYIADHNNHRIRKVDVATGIITTVAGNGSAGYSGDGAIATAASLNTPNEVNLDSSGNIYIADWNNHVIRKVDVTTGIITTVAGNGSAGFSGDDIAATSASLYHPADVSFDSAGNMYIADEFNHRIRMVSVATGIITTVAGNGTFGFSGDGGTATLANLNYPCGTSLDSDGNIFIADFLNHRIRKVTVATGIISTEAGNGTAGFSGDGGAATDASLSSPDIVKVDSAGTIYIVDVGNNRIRKVIKSTPTTAIISYSPAGPYKTGDVVAITATFNDLIVDAPVPQIALSGGNNLAASNMTKVDNRNYTFTHTVTAGNGSVIVSIPTGTDINGIPVSATPASGATFLVNVPPDVTTDPASALSATGAILNGTVSDNGNSTNVTFEYGLSISYGSSVTGGTISAGSGSVGVSTTLSGLACNSIYHYRINGQSSYGTAYGLDQTFATTACASYPLTLNPVGDGEIRGDVLCPAGSPCQQQIKTGTTIYLIAVPSIDATFGGWSGDCTGNGVLCSVTMDKEKNVSADFITAPVALNQQSGIGSPTVQEAYNKALNNDTLKIRVSSAPLQGGLTADRAGIKVFLMGGFAAGFSGNPVGFTTIQKPMKISNGTLVVNRVIIRP
jgi:sugar lactone lactonase YvrE/phosphodiesterase/alkaline phosphatase D-like protein